MELGLRDVWRSKQEDEPGSPLASTFPSKAKLAEAGYTAVEDLDGADCAELEDYAGLSVSDARAVLAAVAAL